MNESDLISGPPVAMGAKLVVVIDDIAFGGEGVARVDDFVLFVPFVLVGERVEVEVVEVKKRFGRTRLLQVVEASPDRVPPPCQHFGRCGGCQYQHLEYGAQLRLKHHQLANLLQRLGHFPHVPLDPVVACPQPYGYRNRIMVRTQWDRTIQGLHFGFLCADSRRVVDVEECAIAEPEVNELLREARQKPPPRGGLKVMLRSLPEDWEVPPDSFFQNNYLLLPELVRAVRGCLHASGARFLVDAYCGVGFFSLELADQVERFVGVELDRPAIKAARRNAIRRQRENGEFIEGQAELLLPSLLSRFAATQTCLVVDPPRTGCPAESLRRLRDAAPAQIVYISCHPATLARDLNLLCADGVYELARVIPLDMFPQTQHIECVADLRWRKPPPLAESAAVSKPVEPTGPAPAEADRA